MITAYLLFYKFNKISIIICRIILGIDALRSLFTNLLDIHLDIVIDELTQNLCINDKISRSITSKKDKAMPTAQGFKALVDPQIGARSCQVNLR